MADRRARSEIFLGKVRRAGLQAGILIGRWDEAKALNTSSDLKRERSPLKTLIGLMIITAWGLRWASVRMSTETRMTAAPSAG